MLQGTSQPLTGNKCHVQVIPGYQIKNFQHLPLPPLCGNGYSHGHEATGAVVCPVPAILQWKLQPLQVQCSLKSCLHENFSF